MFENIMNILFSKKNNRGNNFLRLYNRSNRYIYKLVTFENTKEMIENKQIVLIDVRTQNEFELMHIKGAINIPVSDIEKKIFIYEQNTPIMVYCSSGSRSKNAIEILNSLGYTNIFIWEYAALATFPYKNMLEFDNN